MRTLRILYVITELFPGGAEKKLFDLITGMRERHDIRVTCLYGAGRIAEDLQELGVDVACIEFDTPFRFYRLKRLFSLIRSFQPDIVHTILFHANIAGRIAAKAAGVPVIISSIEVTERERAYHLFFDRWTNFLIDKEICVAKAVKRFTVENAGIPEHKLVVIPNCVEAGDYEVKPLPNGPPQVTFAGRLHRQKGLDILLQAARLVLKEEPETVFNIAGEGPEKKNLEELAVKEGVGENVRFLGFVEDVGKLLGDSRMLVLSSRWEGLPIIILEAMACGRPIAAPDVSGCAEAVEDGKTGLLTAPGNPEALSRAILEILRDPERAAAMGKEGRASVEKNFSVSKMVNTTEELYRTCVESIHT